MISKKSKIVTLLFGLLMVTSSVTGCSSSKDIETETTEAAPSLPDVLLNDYRGGIFRAEALEKEILATVEHMKSNNSVIRAENPNTFWTSDGFQEFVEEFICSSVPNDTKGLNEETSSWEEIEPYILSYPNTFTTPSDDGYESKYSNLEIKRKARNEYEISGFDADYELGDQMYSGASKYICLYDNDKDWLKTIKETTISLATFKDLKIPKATTDLYEYARIDDNTYLIQTAFERIYIVLKPVEKDTSIEEREIKEFYYSRLNGGIKTTFKSFIPLKLADNSEDYDYEIAEYNKQMLSYILFNEYGDMANAYGANDSIFLNDDLSKLDSKWVFEDKALEQTMIYKDGALVVTTYNKLTKRYERFTYKEKGVKDDLITDLEKMVQIEGLVGEVIIPEVILDVDYDEGKAKEEDEKYSESAVTTVSVDNMGTATTTGNNSTSEEPTT